MSADPASMAMGAGAGALQGWLASKRTSGRDTGNSLALNGNDQKLANESLGDLLRYKGSADALDPLQSSRTATSEVQNNGILGQLYGKDGTLGRTVNEEKDLASRGYQLQPQDHEAYGQASDNIARQFGHSDNNLAQALQARGLGGSSAMAGQAFAGSQGNKMEQLAGMQRKIANDRMQSNMQRLGQTRQFLQGMSNQAGNEIQGQYGRQMSSEQQNFNEQAKKTGQAQSWLSGINDQSNENMSQRMASEEQTPWARTSSGALSGAQNAAMMGQSPGGGAMAAKPKGAV